MLTVLIRRCVAACGGKKGERRVRRCGCSCSCCCSGSLQRSRNVLKRSRSLNQEGKNTQKKTKTPPAGGRNTPRLSHLSCLKERQRKNYKTVTQDGRCQLLEAASEIHRPAIKAKLKCSRWSSKCIFFLFFFFLVSSHRLSSVAPFGAAVQRPPSTETPGGHGGPKRGRKGEAGWGWSWSGGVKSAGEISHGENGWVGGGAGGH